MGSIAFDTLSTAENLQKAGVATEQAKAITLAIASVQGDLATRHDLEALEQKLTDKIEGAESNLNSKIGALDNKIDGVRGEMRWVFGGFFALHLLTLTAVIGPMAASLFAGT